MKTEKETLVQVLKYVRKHTKWILLALAAGAVCAGCDDAGSEILKRVVDGLQAGTLTDIAPIVMICAGILAAGAGSAWMTRYASGSASTKILREVKDDAVARITKMTTEFMVLPVFDSWYGSSDKRDERTVLSENNQRGNGFGYGFISDGSLVCGECAGFKHDKVFCNLYIYVPYPSDYAKTPSARDEALISFADGVF